MHSRLERGGCFKDRPFLSLRGLQPPQAERFRKGEDIGLQRQSGRSKILDNRPAVMLNSNLGTVQVSLE